MSCLFYHFSFSKSYYFLNKFTASKKPCLYTTLPYSALLSFVAESARSIIFHSSLLSSILPISLIFCLVSSLTFWYFFFTHIFHQQKPACKPISVYTLAVSLVISFYKSSNSELCFLPYFSTTFSNHS